MKVNKIKVTNNKCEMYEELCLQLEGLLADVPYSMANLANTSALLNQALADINWVGFYLMQEDKLVLGPSKVNRPAWKSPWERACVELQWSVL